MAWVTRQYSKGEIDRSGAILIGDEVPFDEFDHALTVINNWRTCHSYPLHAVTMTLRRRAREVSPNAVIAQRLKRLPSIAIKLEHNEAMKLSQMQDVGGCRAIMPSVTHVNALLEKYDKAKSKNPGQGRPIQHERYDYISSPKPDGYRSCHLVFKYQSEYKDKKPFEGQRIEIQIRSRLQHVWATAVETVQTFTGQALKSKIKAGDPQWLRFFASMGSTIARMENCPRVPNTPTSKRELAKEIRRLANTLSVEDTLSGWGYAIQTIAKEPAGDVSAYLLVLNSEERTLETTAFATDEMKDATEMYLEMEKTRPESQAVLVSVESLAALRTAYPNYYLDTSAFVEILGEAKNG